MGITIKDIAKECGVSVATVSMALSDKPLRVSENTKKKVREIAKKHNYRPNNAAVSLANKKSRLIGIVFNDLRNTHISSLFMAINGVLEKNGYSLVCHIIEDGQTIDTDIIRDIAADNIGALIWSKSMEMNDMEKPDFLKNAMRNLSIPVITMEKYGFDCPGVDILFDYEKGGYMATRHLIECGHRRIGCVAGKQSFHVTMQRLNGYKKALEESGISYDPDLVYFGDYTMESGYEAFSYILGQKVTAIFSMNDEMAFGIYRAARLYGVSIPALEAAKDAGLPYVSFLTSVSGGDDYDGYIYVGSPNEDAGKAQGEYLCDAFPDGASILYFTGAPNDQQYVDRKKGLEEALKKNPNIKILDEYNVENSKDLGMSTAEDSLLSYDMIDAIVCQNDDGALGVVEALKSAGKLDSIQVLGIDGSDDALQSIQDGEMTMTALQDAKAQAEAGADIFEKLKKGTDPADIEDVNIPFKIVTKDNVADYLSK